MQVTKVFAGAGIELARLARVAAEAGLSGLEWAGGIPGATLGGAIFGHAQAFGEKMSDVINSVECLEVSLFSYFELLLNEVFVNSSKLSKSQ